MDIIELTPKNVEEEHICCAISDKKCTEGYNGKKAWLMDQYPLGYRFKKLNVRGKVFIEYVPAENAWVPIEAPNYMHINCFWVSGQYKGKGYGKALFQECLADATGKDGLSVIVASKKQPFMSEKKFFQKQGFELADTAAPYFELWYKKLKPQAEKPSFKSAAKSTSCIDNGGLHVFYTPACPFNEYYVNTELKMIADTKGLPLEITRFTNAQEAQSHVVPITNYSVFYKGRFVTQHILNEKYFEKFVDAK